MLTLDLLDVAPSTLDDRALIDAARDLGELRRRVDAASAAVAAEVQHRSRPEHGTLGLSQRMGAITADRLIERVVGLTGGEARALVRVGVLLTADAEPWLASVSSALDDGGLSIAQADAIRGGLGAPGSDVAADDLADEAVRLVGLAPELPVARLAAAARSARDGLEKGGADDRARVLRDRRYLSLTPRTDGMTRLDGLLDPESAAIVTAAFDGATSPRRGGPRFVDPDEKAAAAALLGDERTIGQIALDAFVDLVRIGAEAEPDRLFGARRHAVRLIVTAADLEARRGTGRFEGQIEPVAMTTVDRVVCDAGILPIQFDDDGEVLRLGRERRLFSSRQRTALEVRDGGCRFPGCERPASWCEAHHTTPWSRGGKTDVADGILLCRHHHRLVHDNSWRIERSDEHGFVAVPPPTLDPDRLPVPMPTRTAALGREHPRLRCQT